VHAFFFDITRRFNEQFPRILGDPASGAAEGNEPNSERGKTLANNYEWFHIIEEMAERDVTKFDAITNTRASTIFAHLSYSLDYYNTELAKMNSNLH
jgi:hypothetical protein